jgi:hypothetical protein
MVFDAICPWSYADIRWHPRHEQSEGSMPRGFGIGENLISGIAKSALSGVPRLGSLLPPASLGAP